jgi:hypothetical protein
LTGQSHFMLIFWLRKVTLRGHINSVKWAPHTQASVPPPPPPTKGGGLDTLRRPGEGVGESKFGRLEKTPSSLFILSNVQKNKKSANQKNLTVHCTVYSVHWLYGITTATCQIESIPYNECTRSHQLRTMTLRSCINSIKSLYAITPTPYIHSTRLHQLRTMNVRSLSIP